MHTAVSYNNLNDLESVIPPARLTNSQPLPIIHEYIFDTLDHYKKDSVAIVAAEWSDGRLDAIVNSIPYPFTKPNHINYMTASMAMLYISQACYINARMIINSKLFPELIDVSDEDFLNARDEGTLVFTSSQIRFRKKIEESSGRFGLRLVMSHPRIIQKRLFLIEYDCTLDNGACKASGNLLMPFNV